MNCTKRNKWDCEGGKVVGVFREGKFELLAFTETKLKRKGEYRGVKLMTSLPVFRRWKVLGKGGWPSC